MYKVGDRVTLRQWNATGTVTRIYKQQRVYHNPARREDVYCLNLNGCKNAPYPYGTDAITFEAYESELA